MSTISKIYAEHQLVSKMKPDASNLKKRKQLAAAAEDWGQPALKHVCCEAANRSKFDLTIVDKQDVEVHDMLTESTQDSNSIPGDSPSLTMEVMSDAGFRKAELYDEASTSLANSRSGISRNDSLSIESSILNFKNGNGMDEYQLPHQDNVGLHDIDCLEECIGVHDCIESKQQAAEQLDGFLASSGMLSSDRWTVDQEAQIGRRKPTIDQEFEQYFSNLML